MSKYFRDKINYLLTYDSYGPMHNRFHRGITWASGGEGALDTPGPLNGIEQSDAMHSKLQRFLNLRYWSSGGET